MKRVKIVFIVFWSIFVLMPAFLLAAEPGYSEAMDYFIQRKNTDRGKQESSVYGPLDAQSTQKEQQASNNKRSKIFLSLGFEQGNNAFKGVKILELGIANNASKWIQSNLSLEWRSIVGGSGDAVAFMYSVQSSSVLFFMGPEIGFGAGRLWVVDNEEGFTSLKLGLNISNPWSKKFLLGFNVYYRRDQGLRKSFHDDRVGALLRFGF